MGFRTTSRQLFSKLESPAGTSADPLDKANSYASPTLQDVRIRNVSPDVENAKDDENSKYFNGDFTGDEAIAGISSGTLDFGIKFAPGELGGSVGAYTHKLNYDKYLKHASLSELVLYDTANAATLADYAYGVQRVYIPTVEASLNTMTHTVVDKDNDPTKNGNATELVGCMADLSIVADTVGAPFTFTFAAQGGADKFSVPAANLPSLVFDDSNVMKTVADKYLNTTITVTDLETDASTTFCSKSFNHASGNQISQTDCQDTESGILYFENTAMQPRVNLMPRLIPLSEYDYWQGMTEERFYRIKVESKYKNADGEVVLQLFYPRCQILQSSITDEETKLYNELIFRPIRNIDKEIPVVKYLDNTDGVTEITWDGTGLTDAQKAEAMWYMVIGEVAPTA